MSEKSKSLVVLFPGPAPAPFRSEKLLVEVTLAPGLNKINDTALAEEMVLRGVVNPVPPTNPNAHADDKNAEPSHAQAGQASRGDLEAAKQSGITSRSELLAARAAAVAVAEAEARLEAEMARLHAELDPKDENAFEPKVRPVLAAITGYENKDQTPEEYREELNDLRKKAGLPELTSPSREDRETPRSAEPASKSKTSSKRK
jgi:hypothetical protein